LADLFTEHTAPEMLFLETRWASLISFGMTVALLTDVLPMAGTTNPETVRQHLHKVAVRQEAELGAGDPERIMGCLPDDPPRPISQAAIIVGIGEPPGATHEGFWSSSQEPEVNPTTIRGLVF
jgi:hypothetical protein